MLIIGLVPSLMLFGGKRTVKGWGLLRERGSLSVIRGMPLKGIVKPKSPSLIAPSGPGQEVIKLCSGNISLPRCFTCQSKLSKYLDKNQDFLNKLMIFDIFYYDRILRHYLE